MLADLSIKNFLEKTASKDPVPGGGSIAALCAAVAAGLSQMVANLTIGRKGYEGCASEMEGIAKEAIRYREKLILDIDRDSDAYAAVMAAFQLPKGTDEEKAERTEAVQNALRNAARVPLSVAEDAFNIMELAGRTLEKGNRNAVTDAAVAAMSARTAVLGALYNVKINLTSIKDAEFCREVRERIDSLERDVGMKEAEILAKVDLQ